MEKKLSNQRIEDIVADLVRSGTLKVYKTSLEYERTQRHNMSWVEKIKMQKPQTYTLSIPHNIGNSMLRHPQNHPLHYQNFFETAQILWNYRKHPNYFGYEGAEEKRLFDLLGLESKTRTELEFALCKSEDLLLFYSTSKAGILTDLIFSFRKRMAHLPGKPGKNEYAAATFDTMASSAYIGSSYIPFMADDWQLGEIGLFGLCYVPSLRNIYKKIFPEQPEIVKRATQEMKRFGIKKFDNLRERSLSLVKKYAPEKYQRFSEAVSLNRDK